MRSAEIESKLLLAVGACSFCEFCQFRVVLDQRFRSRCRLAGNYRNQFNRIDYRFAEIVIVGDDVGVSLARWSMVLILSIHGSSSSIE